MPPAPNTRVWRRQRWPERQSLRSHPARGGPLLGLVLLCIAGAR